ncbi:MAG: hypothetical protein L6R40_002022 [Gallowayella cf. fulva]|nr:MAG: hypothetical protein L6R40_002022 [Xanthomendoza cf. fulva]
MSDSSYIIPSDAPPTPTSSSTSTEVDSLPSSPTTSSLEDEDTDDGREESDAEREWKESLQQLELLLTMVVVPYLGKYFGRKCAYWGWAKFMEWKYPVEIVVTSEKTFKGTGAIEAAASL